MFDDIQLIKCASNFIQRVRKTIADTAGTVCHIDIFSRLPDNSSSVYSIVSQAY